MEIVSYKIEPKTGFHLGTKEGWMESTSNYIHSDTLFSAICNAYSNLYGNDELESFLEKFVQSPQFLISSAFPYVDETLLFPIPFSVKPPQKADIKKFKKIKFVSRPIFESVCKGEGIPPEFQKMIVQEGHVLIGETKELGIKKIWAEDNRPRIVLDRTSSSANIYHVSEIQFNQGCGMHFLIKYLEKDCTIKVEACLRLLQDDGIGGDRSSGKGSFSLSPPTEFNFTTMTADHFVTLSLYHPKKEEISSQILRESKYDLITRGGWIYSLKIKNLRRKRIRMFVEGSVFPLKKDLYGQLKNVTPEEHNIPLEIGKIHKVYRYGYAFPVPIKTEGKP